MCMSLLLAVILWTGWTPAMAVEPCAPGEHLFDTVIEAATETEDGWIVYTCEKCGYIYTDTIPAYGHHYREEVVEPDCTRPGKKICTCDRCGDRYEETYGEALGHRYQSAGAIDDIDRGVTVLTWICDRCGDSYTETLALDAEEIPSEEPEEVVPEPPPSEEPVTDLPTVPVPVPEEPEESTAPEPAVPEDPQPAVPMTETPATQPLLTEPEETEQPAPEEEPEEPLEPVNSGTPAKPEPERKPLNRMDAILCSLEGGSILFFVPWILRYRKLILWDRRKAAAYRAAHRNGRF